MDIRESSDPLPRQCGSVAANGAGLDVPVLVNGPRLLTENDIPWLQNLAQRRYDSRYDFVGTEGWFRNIVLKSPLLFYPARTDSAFIITMLSFLPWLPSEFEANTVLVCADHDAGLEILTLLRDSIEWSRKRRATTWRICSDTEHDIEPLARRVGAGEIAPRYCLRL